MGHTHLHKTSDLNSQQKKLGYTIVLNILMTLAQGLGGVLSGSLSLLSDALHNFSDVVSLVISYIASILSKKEQTVNKTFGYKRSEILAAFINTLTLIVVAVYLIIEAIKRFYQPHEINSKWVIILSVSAIFINGFSAIILQRDAKNNLNIRSAYLHLLSDTLTSVAVLAGGIIMLFYHVFWIDGFLTLAIAVYLVFVTWKLFMESIKVLMLFTPSGVIPEKINDRLCKIPGIQNIHHIHVWQLDTDQVHFEGHIDFLNNIRLSEVNEVMEEIRKILHTEFDIDHVTLQPEFNNCESKDLVSQRH